MRRLLILTAVAAVAVAKPELYKEQENFQYSRSSSDEGSKSGFYGAQRGNMGGNYERAHNMDSLAQNQMSGLVRQVDGELGQGASQRAGSVYTAANSRGTYGSGHFDLSNLAGRNFQEGSNFGSSRSQSSLAQSSSAHDSAAYQSSRYQGYGSSRNSGYQRAASGAQAQTDDLQSLDNTQGSNQYDYGRQSSQGSGYQSQSGFQEHSEYDRSNANLQSGYRSNVGTRFVSATPVRIIVTPVGRAAIPVAAQTYDSTRRASGYDQNALTSESEVVGNNEQGAVYGTGSPKHYESSYRYHKAWEKHDTIPTLVPVVSPTDNSIPKNSELYEEGDARTSSNQYNAGGAISQSAHSSSASGRFNAVKSASSQSQHQSNYDAQQRGQSSNSNSNAYTQAGYNTGSNHAVSSDSLNAYSQSQRDLSSRYHGASSDSSSSAFNQAGYNAASHSDLNSQVEDLNSRPKSYQSSYSYHKSWERQGDPYVIKPASNGYSDGLLSQRLTSSTQNQGYHSQNQANCDLNCHFRVARSYNTDTEDMQQQSQNIYDGQEEGQRVQNTWQNLEILGQESENKWDQQSVGQETQSNWDQQNVGQESQNKWDNLADLGQQSQSNWDQQNVGQESQNKWDNLADLGPQSQSNFDQQNVGQESQNKWDNLEDLGQQSQSNFDQQNVGQESQNKWDNLEDLGQQSQSNWDQQNVGQQSLDQHTWDKQGDNKQKENTNENLENLGQQTQNFQEHSQDIETPLGYKPQDEGQLTQTEHQWENKKPDQQEYSDTHPHKIESPWDKFDTIESSTKKVTFPQDMSKNENNTESNGFYWHQISNNGGMDQQVSDTYNVNFFPQHESGNQNLNTNFDNKPKWDQSSYNPGQTYGNVGFDAPNNPDQQYSYSNGFANPSIHHQQNQFTGYQTTNHEGGNDYQRWYSEMHSHHHSQIDWQEHATNTDNNFDTNSQDSSLSSFWNKFDKIEKESSLPKPMDYMNNFSGEYLGSEHRRDQTYQTESNFTSGSLNDSNIPPQSEYHSSQNVTPINPSSTNQIHPNTEQPELQPVLPEIQKELTSNTNIPKDTQPSSNEEHERPEDIGRGDIGPDYLPNKIDKTTMPNKPRDTVPKLQMTDKFNTHDNTTDRQLTVTNLGQENSKKETSNRSRTIATYDQQQGKHDYNTEEQTTNQNQINTHNAVGQNDQNNYKNQSKYSELNETKQNTQHFNQINQYNYNIEQNNNNISKNTTRHEQQNTNTEQHNLHNIVQENQQENLNQHSFSNFGQENEQDFGQQNLHNFGQQNENLNQQSFNFGQENEHEFGQQNENLEQNLHHFEQENLHDFGQQNENLSQQSLSNFGQENKHDFGQQNNNLEQQNLHNFGQENIQDFNQQYQNPELKHLPKNEEDLRQQNVNLEQHHPHQAEKEPLEDFGQQNVQFGQQNKQFEQNEQSVQENLRNFGQGHGQDKLDRHNDEEQNLQEFGQQSTQEFLSQRENMEQQSIQDFGQQSVVPLNQLDNLNTQQYSRNNIQPLAHPERVEEEPIVQKQHNNLQSDVTSTSEHSKVEAPVEPTTEKPGFWKSVGSKFSSAKDKVASWFRS